MATGVSQMLYATPNVDTTIRLVPQDIRVPFAMRGPGEAPGTFALESAMDELAYALKLDPIELRLRNFAEVDPESGNHWSSNALRECYAQGAERFGWARRTPEPRSMRDGRWLVGWGMAAASFPTVGFPAQAQATLLADGTAVVKSATADLGTGQYTVMTQVAADALGLTPDRVRFELGDTTQPMAFVAGGSSGVRSVGPAVKLAGESVHQKVLELATKDEDSPLGGYGPELIGAEAGELFVRHDPTAAKATPRSWPATVSRSCPAMAASRWR
jgi:xanthine dehydrogenase YagR molybdenum-binding subunit